MLEMIKIRVLRPLFHESKRVEAGVTIKMDPIDACSAVASRRGEFCTEKDKLETYAGVRAQDEKDWKQYGNTRDSFWTRRARNEQ